MLFLFCRGFFLHLTVIFFECRKKQQQQYEIKKKQASVIINIYVALVCGGEYYVVWVQQANFQEIISTFIEHVLFITYTQFELHLVPLSVIRFNALNFQFFIRFRYIFVSVLLLSPASLCAFFCAKYPITDSTRIFNTDQINLSSKWQFSI